MSNHTADMSDALGDDAQICQPVFRSYGRKICFEGKVCTVKCFEDNSMVRKMLESPGSKRVLIVDGQGSMHCALLGDMLASLGIENNWSGIIVNGCIRDSETIAGMDIGVMALGTHPQKSVKRGEGEIDVNVEIAGVWCHPGDYVYADLDGVIVTKTQYKQ